MSEDGRQISGGTMKLDDALRRSVEGPGIDSGERMRARVLAAVRADGTPAVARSAFVRAAAAFAALSVGMGAATFAAAGSLPGSPLYLLKRAMEETQVQLTPRSAQSEALVDLARERVREVRELMDSEAPDAAVDAAVEGFDDAARRAIEKESDPEMLQQRERELQQTLSSEPARVQERVEQGNESPASPDSPAQPGVNQNPDSGSGSGSGTGSNPGEGAAPQAPGDAQGETGPGPGDANQGSPGSKSP